MDHTQTNANKERKKKSPCRNLVYRLEWNLSCEKQKIFTFFFFSLARSIAVSSTLLAPLCSEQYKRRDENSWLGVECCWLNDVDKIPSKEFCVRFGIGSVLDGKIPNSNSSFDTLNLLSVMPEYFSCLLIINLLFPCCELGSRGVNNS